MTAAYSLPSCSDLAEFHLITLSRRLLPTVSQYLKAHDFVRKCDRCEAERCFSALTGADYPLLSIRTDKADIFSPISSFRHAPGDVRALSRLSPSPKCLRSFHVSVVQAARLTSVTQVLKLL
ncbi:hypothetical protein WMY93_033220 [Mugilogobius chulae]|uniref:Uncharacterized protein n=1 Tax=Mugilogobius chulae TaxID=88201 RepID=A0AAW0MTX1_9GOBI